MKLSDFDFDYPKSLIAKYPAEPRDSARLMVVDRAARTITTSLRMPSPVRGSGGSS